MKNSAKSVFPERLRILRSSRSPRMSQTQLAERLGKHLNTISRWETGQELPSLEGMFEISRLFGVSLDYLVGREGAPESRREEQRPPAEDVRLLRAEVDNLRDRVDATQRELRKMVASLKEATRKLIVDRKGTGRNRSA